MISITSEFVTNFIFISGFIIGLGGVTVVDSIGFFGQFSKYFTQTAIRAHKITKPLIWLGMAILLIGQLFAYISGNYSEYLNLFKYFYIPMTLNGFFLSLYVSPRLLKIEKEGRDFEILPREFQNKILASFILSFVCWWSCVILFVLHISQ